MPDIKHALGIPNFTQLYLELLPGQDLKKELTNIVDFMKSITSNRNIKEFDSDNIHVQFINYGRTQLVFVVTVDDSKQYTLLVNQPATKYGVGKNEYNNLNKLNQIDKEIVIKPMYYFEKDNYELYITLYYHQARCIGVDTNKWGIWIPEPFYHFECFNDDDKKIVNSTMIAILIKLYDEENNKGISGCRLDGGDFMLLKDFENSEVSFDNIINNIKLIASRELITISLDDYINRLRIELSNKEDNDLIVVGKRLRQPFTEEEIELGIEMGLALRNQNTLSKTKK